MNDDKPLFVLNNVTFWLVNRLYSIETIQEFCTPIKFVKAMLLNVIVSIWLHRACCVTLKVFTDATKNIKADWSGISRNKVQLFVDPVEEWLAHMSHVLLRRKYLTNNCRIVRLPKEYKIEALWLGINKGTAAAHGYRAKGRKAVYQRPFVLQNIFLLRVWPTQGLNQGACRRGHPLVITAANSNHIVAHLLTCRKVVPACQMAIW